MGLSVCFKYLVSNKKLQIKVKDMSYCPKCGTKVREEMGFCPKCGAALKVEQPPAEAAPPTPYRAEKAEKHEKREKEEKEERPEKRGEKAEKHEKREFGYIGSLIGGLILIFIGLMSYLALTASINLAAVGAIFVVVIGIIIIVGAVYAAMMASRRHPAT